jgi:hypothetical protein
LHDHRVKTLLPRRADQVGHWSSPMLSEIEHRPAGFDHWFE